MSICFVSESTAATGGGKTLPGELASSKHHKQTRPKPHLSELTEPPDLMLPCGVLVRVGARCRRKCCVPCRSSTGQHKQNSGFVAPPLCLSIATNDPRIFTAICCAWLDSPLLVMEKLQVRSLWAAHLMSWTAFIMVLVWALAYQVKPWHLRDTEYLTASNMKWHYWR